MGSIKGLKRTFIDKSISKDLKGPKRTRGTLVIVVHDCTFIVAHPCVCADQCALPCVCSPVHLASVCLLINIFVTVLT